MPLLSRKGRDLPRLFATIIPCVSLSVCILFAAGVTVTGNSELAIKGLYLLVPIALVALVAVLKPNSFREGYGRFRFKLGLAHRHFAHLVLLFALLFIITICLLIACEIRPLAYFCLVAAMAGLIVMETLLIEPEQSGRKAIILTQIVALSLNLTLGQTLKLPLYFGYTDILPHMRAIESIGAEGHITSAMGFYQYFPLFHVFHFTGMSVTDMDLQGSFFILGGLCFIVSILIVYLLARQLTRNAQVPLLAALMYCITAEVVFGGMYMITRTMAYVLCLLILYLLIRGRRHGRMRVMATALVIPLILTHQTTLVQFTFIFLLIIATELILYRRSRHIQYAYMIWFTAAYIAYWVFLTGPFFDLALRTMVTTTSGTVHLPDTGASQDIFTTLLRNTPSAIMVLLVMLGIVALLRQNRHLKGPGHAFALFSIVALVLWAADLSSFLASGFFAGRLELLSTPFVAFAAAAGVALLAGQLNTNRDRATAWAMGSLALVLVIVYCFSSVTVLGTTTDVDWDKLAGKRNHEYFTQAELTSFSFMVEHASDDTTYSDWESGRYLMGFLTNAGSSVREADSVDAGYFLFREGEYRSTGQLRFVLPVYSEETHTVIRGLPFIHRDDDVEYFSGPWEQETRVFDNGAVRIYQK